MTESQAIGVADARSVSAAVTDSETVGAAKAELFVDTARTPAVVSAVNAIRIFRLRDDIRFPFR